MILNIAKIQEVLSPGKAKIFLLNFIEKKGRGIFLMGMLILAGYCGYIWYIHVAHSEWDQTKKQEYINSRDKEVLLNRKKFDSLVEEKEARSQRYQNNPENIPDIFRLD